jgi:hypothetical protein
MKKRTAVLQQADNLINGDRQASYGDASVNFRRIAERWTQILRTDVEPWQVALMMADLKIARMCEGAHEDSFIDGLGYLALASELADQ